MQASIQFENHLWVRNPFELPYQVEGKPKFLPLWEKITIIFATVISGLCTFGIAAPFAFFGVSKAFRQCHIESFQKQVQVMAPIGKTVEVEVPAGVFTDHVLAVHDLSVKQLRNIECTLRPGNLSLGGFLDEKESLKTRCETDDKTLQGLGVTYDRIANTLLALMNQSDKEKGENVNFCIGKTKLRIKRKVYRGMQACPFVYKKNRCPATNKDYVITNIQTEKTITVSGLMPHLIGKHHFFEGNVPYRVDPQEACEVLGLV